MAGKRSDNTSSVFRYNMVGSLARGIVCRAAYLTLSQRRFAG